MPTPDQDDRSKAASFHAWRHRLGRVARIVITVVVIGFLAEIGLNLAPGQDDHGDLAALLSATPPPASPGPLTLCVDGPEFMAALDRDIAAARERVAVQTLSFEADPAGRALAAALLACRAPERLLIIDSYARHVISDRLLTPGTRLLRHDLRREVRDTEELVAALRADGVEVHYSRPLGWRLHQLAVRDHKKLVAIDDSVAYIGGINFSEHNFLWHDLMLRIENGAAARWLAADMRLTSAGNEQTAHASFGGFELYVDSGPDDADLLTPVAAAIAAARDSIYVECPYITEPFHTLLAEARARGVAVTIVTSERNNRVFMKQSIEAACGRGRLNLRLTPGAMTHVKAMLVDGERLIFGSANFDFLSFGCQPEVLAVVTEPGAIAQFRRRVVAPALAGSRPWTGDGDGVRMRMSHRMIHLAEPILRRLAGARQGPLPSQTKSIPESSTATSRK